MKKLLPGIILILLFNGLANAQVPNLAFEWLNSSPQGNKLINFFIIDDNKAIFTTTPNTIATYSKTGSEWHFYQYPSEKFNNFDGLYFINSNTGWAGSDKGVIIKTTNGGSTWTEIISSSQDRFKELYFYDNNTGYAISGFLKKTTDGGHSWNYTGTPVGPDDYEDMIFLNDMTGWIVNRWPQNYQDRTDFYRTTNGGNTWEEMTCPFIDVPFYSTFFINENIGWITGKKGLIHKTYNGGLNWEAIDVPNGGSLLKQIHFANELTGWVNYTGDNNTNICAKTTNGGYNWQPISSGFISSYDTDLKFKGNTGLMINDLRINLTTDAGNTWNDLLVNTHKRIEKVYFINENDGWGGSDLSRIYKTNDGGKNWVDANNLGTQPIKQIYFLNNNTGYIISNSQIFRTTDGGSNWTTVYDDPNYPLIGDIHFIPGSDSGIVTGRYFILKTANNGLSWFIDQHTAYTNLLSTQIFSDGTGWLIDNSVPADLYKTTNHGFNWTQVNSFNEATISIKFLNESTGWRIYDTYINSNKVGVMQKTTDGGISWSILHNSLPTDIDNFKFFNENDGFLVGNKLEGASLYVTSNGGQTFNSQPFTSNNVISFFQNGDSTTWFTLHNIYNKQFMLKTTSLKPGVVTGLTGSTTEIPDEYLLHQNHPNPFNPVTKISFNLPTSTIVKLTVYNLLGQEVSQLVNESLNAGTYSYTFDGSNLTSGVYFYRLSTDGFSELKKMVLVK